MGGAEQGEGPVLSVHCIHSNVFSQKSDCSNIVVVAFNQFECIMKTKTKTQLRQKELSVFFVQKYT